MSKKRPVLYVPPSSEQIEWFAKEVCKRSGETNPQVAWGFASFLKVISKSLADSMTKSANESQENEDGIQE